MKDLLATNSNIKTRISIWIKINYSWTNSSSVGQAVATNLSHNNICQLASPTNNVQSLPFDEANNGGSGMMMRGMTAKNFDPVRYAGRWFEVASLKRGFAGQGQEDCHCTQVLHSTGYKNENQLWRSGSMSPPWCIYSLSSRGLPSPPPTHSWSYLQKIKNKEKWSGWLHESIKVRWQMNPQGS